MTVVRERPAEVRRCFSLILVAPLVIVSCLAQEGPKEEASLQGPELSDKQIEQVAEILGIDQGPLQETLTWLAQEEVPIRDAIIFVIFAQKRTLRQVGPTTITTDIARQVFQDAVRLVLKRYREDPAEWKSFLSSEAGLSNPTVNRQASSILRQVVLADQMPEPRRRFTPIALPEHLSEVLSERFQVKHEVLEEAWEEVGSASLQTNVMLLILAREKTDQLLEIGAVTPEEQEKAFLKNVQLFQRQQGKAVGWGDLAIQVGLHANDLNHQAHFILKGFLDQKVEVK